MSEHTPLTEAEVLDAVQRAVDDEVANLADDGARLSHSVVRRLEAILAARTSTATADTGLRERLADAWDEGRNFRPFGTNPYRDATPASTEDRADNEGTGE